MTYNKRKEAAEKAEKAVSDLNNLLPQINGNTTVDQVIGLQNTYEKIAEIGQDAQALRNQGKVEQAEQLEKEIVYHQALQNFRTGTADRLYEVYETIAGNESFDSDILVSNSEIPFCTIIELALFI